MSTDNQKAIEHYFQWRPSFVPDASVTSPQFVMSRDSQSIDLLASRMDIGSQVNLPAGVLAAGEIELDSDQWRAAEKIDELILWS